MPHLVPQPVSFNVSRTPNGETSGKDTYSEAKIMMRTPHQKVKKNEGRCFHCLTVFSLWLKSFERSANQKYKKLKGGYSANAILVFNSWLKDIEMCVKEWKWTNMEAVWLVKDYTSEGPRGGIEFYLDTKSTWTYHELIEHLRTSFKSGETVSSLVRDFYTHGQWPPMSYKF